MLACLVGLGSIQSIAQDEPSDSARKVTRYQFGNSAVWLEWNGNRVLVWNSQLEKMILFVDAYNFKYLPRPGFDGIHIDEGYGAFVINSRTLLIVTHMGEGLILPSSSNAMNLTGTIEYTMDRVPVFLFYDDAHDVKNIVILEGGKVHAVPIKDPGLRLDSVKENIRARSARVFIANTNLPLIEKKPASVQAPDTLTTKRLTGPGANADIRPQPVKNLPVSSSAASQFQLGARPDFQKQFEPDPTWDEPDQLIELGFDYLLAVYPYGKLGIVSENAKREYETHGIVPLKEGFGLPVSVVKKPEGNNIVITYSNGQKETLRVMDILAQVLPKPADVASSDGAECAEGLKPPESSQPSY
jgi:hypothetical protein